MMDKTIKINLDSIKEYWDLLKDVVSKTNSTTITLLLVNVIFTIVLLSEGNLFGLLNLGASIVVIVATIVIYNSEKKIEKIRKEMGNNP